MPVARHHQLVVPRQLPLLQHQLLDLRGKEVDAADDQHVIAAAHDLAHAPHAARRGRQQAREVPRAVADDRQGLLRQRGEDQFALAAVRQHFARVRIDDLGVEVILPDHRAVLGLHALTGHARAHHLAQAIDVHGLDAGAALDVAAHLLGPRFGAEDAHLHRHHRRVLALAAELLHDHLHVAGGDHDDVGLEVLDQLHLLFGLPAAHGDDGAAQALGPVVRAQTAREQTVAIGHMHHVAPSAPGRADAAGHQVGPAVDVALRVAHHRGLARGAGRGVDAHDLITRHGEQAERVVGPQVSLGSEGELRQIRQGLAVRRVHTLGIESLAVVRHLVVGVLQGPLQALQLQGLQLVAAGTFDGLEVAGGGVLHGHRAVSWSALGVVSADLAEKWGR